MKSNGRRDTVKVGNTNGLTFIMPTATTTGAMRTHATTIIGLDLFSELIEDATASGNAALPARTACERQGSVLAFAGSLQPPGGLETLQRGVLASYCATGLQTRRRYTRDRSPLATAAR
jgi:hypothetical protein